MNLVCEVALIEPLPKAPHTGDRPAAEQWEYCQVRLCPLALPIKLTQPDEPFRDETFELLSRCPCRLSRRYIKSKIEYSKST